MPCHSEFDDHCVLENDILFNIIHLWMSAVFAYMDRLHMLLL